MPVPENGAGESGGKSLRWVSPLIGPLGAPECYTGRESPAVAGSWHTAGALRVSTGGEAQGEGAQEVVPKDSRVAALGGCICPLAPLRPHPGPGVFAWRLPRGARGGPGPAPVICSPVGAPCSAGVSSKLRTCPHSLESRCATMSGSGPELLSKVTSSTRHSTRQAHTQPAGTVRRAWDASWMAPVFSGPRGTLALWGTSYTVHPTRSWGSRSLHQL